MTLHASFTTTALTPKRFLGTMQHIRVLMYVVQFAVAATVWYLFQNTAWTDISDCTACLVLSQRTLLQATQLHFHLVLDSTIDPCTSGPEVWQAGDSLSCQSAWALQHFTWLSSVTIDAFGMTYVCVIRVYAATGTYVAPQQALKQQSQLCYVLFSARPYLQFVATCHQYQTLYVFVCGESVLSYQCMLAGCSSSATAAGAAAGKTTAAKPFQSFRWLSAAATTEYCRQAPVVWAAGWPCY